ncbi:small GTP-binding protein [Methanothermus fervidus DSM 2088]|uniref:Small GTP-binding protein n=1 Tax=Methanothermus fervidus (strain ATCC 43054 / DSM 2088 / JCM 10308 / V24 S) TaxID=523846 RepID=E3GXE7_METFV|nr:small GTP-binding protein [Methanothermus fervidus DSM 2088]
MIKELEEEIRRTPYNKATARHIGRLKARIAKLREEASKKSGKSKGKGFLIKKTGDATVVLVGFPSVGKSTLLNKLTNAESKVGNYQFTTLNIVPGMLEYKGAKIQIFDIPGIIKGASEGKGRGREVLSSVRAADLIVVVMDVFNLDYDTIINELRNVDIRPGEKPPDIRIKKKERGGINIYSTNKVDEEVVRSILREYNIYSADVIIREKFDVDRFIDAIAGNRTYIPVLKVVNKIDLVNKEYLKHVKSKFPDAILVSAKNNLNIDKLKEEIFKNLNLIRIYTKKPGKDPNYKEPLIMRKGCTIEDVCKKLHKSFLEDFRYARVWGKSAKFNGQKVGLEHVLEDGDIVQIIKKV